MPADCHIHMVLDGADWKRAIARHRESPNIPWIRNTLKADKSEDGDHALSDIYRVMRPGEPPTRETAERRPSQIPQSNVLEPLN